MPRGASRLGASYWRLWAASSVSMLGDGLVLVALPLLAAEQTSNGLLIAGVAAAETLPWLFLALPAGALADRLDRRRLMVAADLARVAATLLIALAVVAGTTPIALIYAFAFAMGALECLFSAASYGVVPDLVEADDLSRANGLLTASRNAAGQLAGPAAGGWLFAAAASAPFLGDAATFAASAALLWRARFGHGAAHVPPVEVTLRRTFADALDGARWLVRDPLARTLTTMVGGLSLGQAMATGVLVLFASSALGVGASGYGVLLAIAAIGTVAGGLVVDRLTRLVGTATVLAVTGLGSATAFIVVSQLSSPIAAGAVLAIEGFGVSCGGVAGITMMQQHVPRELRGRIGNAVRTVVFGVTPIGALLGGAIASLVDVRTAVLVAGIGQVVVVALLVRPLRRHAASAGPRSGDDAESLPPTADVLQPGLTVPGPPPS